MGAAVWRKGFAVALLNLSVDYSQPLPLGQSTFVEARLLEREGRAIRAQGEIRLADGTMAVEGRGLYVEAPHLFEHPFYQEREVRT
jgi:acyl-CoA thioesterase FadM